MSDITHLKDLKHDPQNARKHTPRNLGMIERSLGQVGTARSIVIDEDGIVLAGNATIEAAAAAGIERVQVVDSDGETLIAVRRTGLTPTQKTDLALFDNRSAELAEWDTDVLASLGESIDLSQFWTRDELGLQFEQDIALGSDEAADGRTPDRPTLAERFGVPPFSVLDARQGYWQERKRSWLTYGIKSELGRGEGITWGDSLEVTEPGLNFYRNRTSPGADGKTLRGDGVGKPLRANPPGASDGRGGLKIDDTRRSSRTDNGLLGFSEQARSHYRAGPARMSGQDLMRGEHVVGGKPPKPSRAKAARRPCRRPAIVASIASSGEARRRWTRRVADGHQHLRSGAVRAGLSLVLPRGWRGA
jgi:hypothetical protein